MSINYRVRISHVDKGIGICAKRAIHNLVKQSKSPVNQVRVEENSGSSTSLIVSVDSGSYEEVIRSAIQVSGRMPTKGGYSIDSIELMSDGSSEDVGELKKRYLQIQGEVRGLREKNSKLESNLSELQSEFRSPLESVLRYIEGNVLETQSIFGSEREIDYLGSIFSSKGENFYDYLREVKGLDVSLEDVEAFERRDHSLESEINSLEEGVRRAKEEIDFYNQIKEGVVKLPDSIRDSTLKLIESHRPFEVIESYKEKLAENSRLSELRVVLDNSSDEYSSFRENVELLRQVLPGEEGIPLVVDLRSVDNKKIYFPFKKDKASLEFKERLDKDLREFLANLEVDLCDQENLICYSIGGEDDLVKRVLDLSNKTLTSFLSIGQNKLSPIILS